MQGKSLHGNLLDSLKITSMNHEQLMRRCIELAEKGAGHTAPNPKVGALVVHEGKIIGEGYHQSCGKAHAEVNAIDAVQNKDLLKNSTLYVNLEPCSHHGKTPPCADLIVSSEIPRVVVGMKDPHKKVAGNGIKKLLQAGIDVITDIVEDECRFLNRDFITYHTKNRPFIVLKWAESADGFIDIEREYGVGTGPYWITDEVCRQVVHKWRSEIQAILVGTNTALKDNPSLTVREWNGKNPLRLLIDKKLKVPESFAILDGIVETVVFTSAEKKLEKENVSYYKLNNPDNAIPEILEYLHGRNIISLMVEGGTKLLESFIREGLWDEARVFVGNNKFGKGTAAPIINHRASNDTIISNSKLKTYTR